MGMLTFAPHNHNDRPMSIKAELAHSLGIRNEEPNKALATVIAKSNDTHAVQELISLLQDKDSNIRSDAVKVLDEIGSLTPGLVAPYADEIIALLTDRNNRMIW